jgi:hypothetical protein
MIDPLGSISGVRWTTEFPFSCRRDCSSSLSAFEAASLIGDMISPLYRIISGSFPQLEAKMFPMIFVWSGFLMNSAGIVMRYSGFCSADRVAGDSDWQSRFTFRTESVPPP